VSGLDLTEAIELASRVIFESDDGTWKSWNQLAPTTQDYWRDKARLAVETAAPLLERQVRERVAREIEASIILDDEVRYASCTCLAGVECHPHACHRVLNKVPADEDTWPVDIKVGAWLELDPLIRNHAAAIARGGVAHNRQDKEGQE
jgi:hypothetical protein